MQQTFLPTPLLNRVSLETHYHNPIYVLLLLQSQLSFPASAYGRASALQQLNVTVWDDSDCYKHTSYHPGSTLCAAGPPGGVCLVSGLDQFDLNENKNKCPYRL